MTKQEAYEKARALSAEYHGRVSTQVMIDQSDVAEWMQEMVPNGRLTAITQIPDELAESFATDDEQAAACAGWIDGAMGREVSRFSSWKDDEPPMP